jgi:hypothetical protein
MSRTMFLYLFIAAAIFGPLIGQFLAERLNKGFRERERRDFSRIFREEFVKAAEMVGNRPKK